MVEGVREGAMLVWEGDRDDITSDNNEKINVCRSEQGFE